MLGLELRSPIHAKQGLKTQSKARVQPYITTDLLTEELYKVGLQRNCPKELYKVGLWELRWAGGEGFGRKQDEWVTLVTSMCKPGTCIRSDRTEARDAEGSASSQPLSPTSLRQGSPACADSWFA